MLCESVPLDDDFVLAYLPSWTRIVKGEATIRNRRSNSVTSSIADVSQLRLLQGGKPHDHVWAQSDLAGAARLTIQIR